MRRQPGRRQRPPSPARPARSTTGTATTCTATVTDTQSSGASTPTGTVTLHRLPHHRPVRQPRQLHPQRTATTGIASCQTTFTPSTAASYTLTANYTGDTSPPGQQRPVHADHSNPDRTARDHPGARDRQADQHIRRHDQRAGELHRHHLLQDQADRLRARDDPARQGDRPRSVRPRATKKTITIASKTATIPAGSHQDDQAHPEQRRQETARPNTIPSRPSSPSPKHARP